MKTRLGIMVACAAVALSAAYAMPLGVCGAATVGFDDSGHSSGSDTGTCYSSASKAGDAAKYNLELLIILDNTFTCPNLDCQANTCTSYVFYHSAGQPVVAATEVPPGSGCWKATASYTSGNISLGCTACRPQ